VAVLDLLHGDCRAVMAGLPAASVDAVVCDPPYGLSFMGKDWDHGVPGVAFWSAALRVAKPGAHLLAFGGTRTFHRLAVAIEDAGWEIRDTVMWVYGSGFPKSHNVGKGIDKAAGAEREVVGRKIGALPNGTNKLMTDALKPILDITAPATEAARQWNGWGTALKPAWEPIIVARKPLEGTVAANVLAHGTGAMNIDGCRVQGALEGDPNRFAKTDGGWGVKQFHDAPVVRASGRWPANLIHDGSDEVTELFPNVKAGTAVRHNSGGNTFGGDNAKPPMDDMGYADSGSAARFFYCAKASKADRDEGCEGMEARLAMRYGEKAQGPLPQQTPSKPVPQRNHHPTVKPTALMRYLCKLVTPPAGTVLDPFMGSGSTGKAARMDGFGFIGIEQDAEYIAIARARIAHAVQSPAQQPLHI